ncbi:glycosyltransferase family 4 protein [Thermoplasma sp. Kam2015]|uniref:glycosyltransferase family 4 protein n=1 Tax=Thermoplasma sp. Kam2015 TaxID=2094122 RepID=UPI001F4183A0|nr:glycosyltransferase family 4 protein [Thermoplasma sp. Kam2015]
MIETHYDYRENMPYILLLRKIMQTRADLKNIFSKYKFDITFNNHPNMFLYNADINALHGFSFLDPIIDEYGNIEKRFIFEAIKRSHLYDIYDGAVFYVNSKYTLGLAKSLFPRLGIKPRIMKVIYIPVEPKEKVDLSNKMDNTVISIGRINKGKNYDLLMDIARKLDDYRFYIVGAVNEGDEKYYDYLMRIKPKNVEIIPNADESTKNSLLKKSSIYLHTNRKENYGISILEAMSYGIIPVVPKSGGPWLDITEEGKYGYGYGSVEEAVEVIGSIDQNRRIEVYESMGRFSYDKFKQGIEDLMNTAMK